MALLIWEKGIKNASSEGRRRMFLSIGENYQIMGNKLNVYKPLWLQAIKKYKKGVEAEVLRFELEEYIDINVFSLYFKDMFPLMCTLVDEVQNAIVIDPKNKGPSNEESY